MTWRRWFALMLISTVLFLAWGYRYAIEAHFSEPLNAHGYMTTHGRKAY